METVRIRAYKAVMETRYGVDQATVYDDPIEPKYPTEEAAVSELMDQLGYVPAKKENSGYPGYWDGNVGAYFDYIGSTDIEIPETIVQRIIRSRQTTVQKKKGRRI